MQLNSHTNHTTATNPPILTQTFPPVGRPHALSTVAHVSSRTTKVRDFILARWTAVPVGTPAFVILQVGDVGDTGGVVSTNVTIAKCDVTITDVSPVAGR